MIKSIREERLNRLKVRKNFDEKYNVELVKFLKNNINNEGKITKTVDYINNIEFIHPGLNSIEYIVHPLRIAKIIYQLDNNIDIDILNIALLHNIFEVSEITEKDFLLEYDYTIMNYLKVLKVDRSLEKDLKYKKKYYREIYKNKETSIVKAIDKLDNLFLLCLNNNDEVRIWYLNEVEEYIFPIVKKYIPTLLQYYKELVEDCRKFGFLSVEKSIKIYNEDYS